MLVPPILMETGKVKNPWPNVDAHSGVLLQVLPGNFFAVLWICTDFRRLDPDLDWECGSGSNRAKKGKSEEMNCFEGWMFSFEGWKLL
jgi:hypothetical protein